MRKEVRMLPHQARDLPRMGACVGPLRRRLHRTLRKEPTCLRLPSRGRAFGPNVLDDAILTARGC